jgi:phage shock protein A
MVFRKWYNYMKTWFGIKSEEMMDPEVQIQQALEELNTNHHKLKKAAAEVITNQKMIEKRLANRTVEVDQIKNQIKTALLAVEREKTSGDAEKAAKYEQAAETLAVKYKSTEQLLEQDREQYAVAEKQAKDAQDAIYANSIKLEEERNKAAKLRNLSKQAKMQRALNEANQAMQEVGTLRSSPTLSQVESKLQEQLSREEAKADIHSASADGIMDELRADTIKSEATDTLDSLRAELGLEAPAPAETPAEASTVETADAGASGDGDSA